MRKNEHPGCGCRQCRRGAGTKQGQQTHRLVNRLVNRQIRHNTKTALRTMADPLGLDFVSVIVPTPYTD